MNKFKHTPGPWFVPHIANLDISCNCRSILSEGYCGGIGEVFVDNGKRISDGGNDCPPLEQAIANARLIASAPELLETLQYVLNTIDDSDEWWMDHPDRGGFDVKKILSVIKKATGQDV